MKIIMLLFIILLGVVAYALAQSGPHIATIAPVSVSTACATVIAASTPVAGSSYNLPRLCVELNNVGGTPAVCGDAPVGGTSAGSYIAALGSKTYCVTDALKCCGVGGSTTITGVESRR